MIDKKEMLSWIKTILGGHQSAAQLIDKEYIDKKYENQYLKDINNIFKEMPFKTYIQHNRIVISPLQIINLILRVIYDDEISLIVNLETGEIENVEWLSEAGNDFDIEINVTPTLSTKQIIQKAEKNIDRRLYSKTN